jgi:hypothetical protein
VIDTAFGEGKDLKTLEFAKTMKEDNEPIDEIIKYTGLTEKDVESL